jgi:hypothetical protein
MPFGVRWQARRDTAFLRSTSRIFANQLALDAWKKRRRCYALPAQFEQGTARASFEPAPYEEGTTEWRHAAPNEPKSR